MSFNKHKSKPKIILHSTSHRRKKTLRQYILLPLAFLAGLFGMVVMLDMNGGLKRALSRAAATPSSSNKFVYLLGQTNWILAFIILTALVGWGLYLYIDYHSYRRPLVREMPSVHYTLTHHLKVVSLPKMYYNWRPLAIKSALIPGYTLVYTVASIFALMHVFALAPTVYTLSATSVTSSSANLNGTVSSSDQPVTEHGFEYGTDTSYGLSLIETTHGVTFDSTFVPSQSGNYGGLAVAPSGRVYATVGNTIKKFNNTGFLLSTIGVTGSAEGQFNNPSGVSVDSAGNLYVVDSANFRIQKFDSSDHFVSTFGWGVQDGSATFQVCTSGCQAGIAGSGEGQFGMPYCVGIDNSDSVYVCDFVNSRILKFSSSGTYSSQIGSAGNSDGQLAYPLGLDFDSSNNMFVGDRGNSRVQKFDSTGNFVLTFGWGVQDGSATFQVCTSGCQAGIAGSGDGQFYNKIQGIAIDSHDHVYVNDQDSDRIEEFSSSGAYLDKWGSHGSADDQFTGVYMIATDSSDRIYATDSGNTTIKRFTPSNHLGDFALSTSDNADLTCGTTYHFRAYATSDDGTNYGDDATFTTTACPPPGAPTNVNFSSGYTTPTSMFVAWDVVTGNNVEYNLQYKLHSSDEWTTYQTAFPGGLTYRRVDLIHLQPNTNYDIRVAAITDSGQGNWSNVVSNSTLAQTTYHITNCSQLENMNSDLGGKYILDNDIDCSDTINWGATQACVAQASLVTYLLQQLGQGTDIGDLDTIQTLCQEVGLPDLVSSGFVPIGFGYLYGFTGTLDGQGYAIKNLYIGGGNFQVGNGLFSGTAGAIIKNVELTNATVNLAWSDADLFPYSAAGGLAGFSSGTFISDVNVDLKATVTNDSSSTDSFSFGTFGGLYGVDICTFTAGEASACQLGTITRSSATVDIVMTAGPNLPSSKALSVGGLVGWSQTDITNSYATGSIEVDSGSSFLGIGGLMASQYFGRISNSYSNIAITAQNTSSRENFVGGLVGSDIGYITNSFSTSSITTDFTSGSNFIGGLVAGQINVHDIGSIVDNGVLANNYWDKSRSGVGSCVQGLFEYITNGPEPSFDTLTDDACKAVNLSNDDPNYFLFNHSKGPLGSWDFGTVWRTNANALPTLGQNSVPDPPRDLGGTANSSSVSINWEAPQDNGGRPIVNYLVQYRVQGSSVWQTHDHTESTARQYEITGLQSDKTYEFQIAAVNEIGQSTWVLGIATIRTTGPTPVIPITPAIPTTTKTKNPKPETEVSPVIPPPASQEQAKLDAPGVNPVKGDEAQPITSSHNPIFNILPWLFILLLLILAILYLYRALREYRLRIALQAELKRAQNLAETLKTFINIVSHYLNTPFSIMRGTVELMSSGIQASETVLGSVGKSLQSLKNNLEALLNESAQLVTASNAPLANVVKPNKSSWREVFSPSVSIPIAAAILCIALVEVAGIRVHSLDRPGFVIAMSGITVILIAGLIVFFEHFRLGQKDLRAQLRDILAAETQSIAERSELMRKVSATLKSDHAAIESASAQLATIPQSRPLFNGLAMLKEVIDKTNKLDYFASMPAATTPLLVGPILNNVRSSLLPFADTKNIKLLLTVPAGLTAALNSEQVIQLSSSLVNNAIKFGNEGTVVQLTAHKKGHNTVIKVTNHGPAIDPEKRAHLFEPFSRATSTELYNYEGLGVNLFVDKLIAQQVNGSLTLTSNNQATTFTLTVPTGKKPKSVPVQDHTNVIRPTVVGSKL